MRSAAPRAAGLGGVPGTVPLRVALTLATGACGRATGGERWHACVPAADVGVYVQRRLCSNGPDGRVPASCKCVGERADLGTGS